MNERNNIAERIDELIRYSNKTKRKVAEEIGVSEVTVGQYTNAKAIPSLLTFKKLCIALDCDYQDILGELPK